MVEWIENGALLGWLIGPRHKQVFIYAPGEEVRILDAPNEVKGTGPVEGFTLDPRHVWKWRRGS